MTSDLCNVRYPKENIKRDMNTKSDKMNSNDAHRGKTERRQMR